MDNSTTTNFSKPKQKKVRRWSIEEEFLPHNISRKSMSDTQLSTSFSSSCYYTARDSFERSFSLDHDQLITDDSGTCYQKTPEKNFRLKRIPSPILLEDKYLMSDVSGYSKDMEGFLTNDLDSFKSSQNTSASSVEIGVLNEAFIRSLPQVDRDLDSDDSDYDVLKTGRILSILSKKDADNSETSSEDDFSPESSSDKENDEKEKYKYYIKEKRDDAKIKKCRTKIPKDVDFENIDLRDARLFMKYLDDDYPETRPKNVQYFFIKRFFKKRGKELMDICFKIFNMYCFGNSLPDSITLEWNNRLRKTAGTTVFSKKKEIKIVLSDKVCSKPYRVRDTLIHEMCHAASFAIDRVFNDGHGPSFKKWATICGMSFPEMPQVSRCHNYDIEAKFHYICEGCQQTIKRHSKSLNVLKKVCGKCRGRFVLHVQGKKDAAVTVEEAAEVEILSRTLNNSKL